MSLRADFHSSIADAAIAMAKSVSLATGKLASPPFLQKIRPLAFVRGVG